MVGNHLAQHAELSLTARGLALYIQSLPTGTPIGIKDLNTRFPEGEHRIAGCLRELEAHGYLARTRERLPNGHVVTRTYSYNHPGSTPHHPPPPDPPPPDPRPDPDPDPDPTDPPPPPPDPRDPDAYPVEPPPDPPADAPAPAPGPPPPAEPTPPAEPPSTPAEPTAWLTREAHRLLASLRQRNPRLLLAERDVRRLAPLMEEWLVRGAQPEAILRTLSADLPDDVWYPAAFLAHRLKALLPAPIPVHHLPSPVPAPDQVVHPLQNCDRCDHAHRAPTRGLCPACARSKTPAAA
ncbi:helix-turn-helix domain-containing protein [Streptomyces bambusae]|uniref:helix-turn-helix domain-containing protein n=1 Tax=Streptomyces bambusae TaxID=1550616 RepID=UPI001CFCE05C|nr:helix-turn-helix domain-containing protein [Streptomyces bambusae]MCB5168511.1 helix-turn-helix domain-containing protein [Streptomyces bambusae]